MFPTAHFSPRHFSPRHFPRATGRASGGLLDSGRIYDWHWPVVPPVDARRVYRHDGRCEVGFTGEATVAFTVPQPRSKQARRRLVAKLRRPARPTHWQATGEIEAGVIEVQADVYFWGLAQIIAADDAWLLGLTGEEV